MPPFRVDYYCPREGEFWQRFGAWALNRAGKSFPDSDSAIQAANSLIFRYHRARVVDSRGVELYRV